MDWWEDDFCARLAAGPRFVIRYDHRDTGQSVSYPPGAPGYTGDDLVARRHRGARRARRGPSARRRPVDGRRPRPADRARASRARRLADAHRHESRRAGRARPAGHDRPRGVPPSRQLAEPDWSDRAAVIDYATELSRASAGRSRPFDEQGTRALWERVLDRTTNIESSMRNHYATEGGGRWRERLGAIDVPALVVHGTEDPLFPLAPRRSAGARDPRRRAARAGGIGPRAGATRLGRRRAGDPAAHAGSVNVSGCEPSTSVNP